MTPNRARRNHIQSQPFNVPPVKSFPGPERGHET